MGKRKQAQWRTIFHYLAISTITLLTTPANATLLNSAERDYLVSLYNHTGGDNWTIGSVGSGLHEWLNGDPCDNKWYGIICNTMNNTVIHINADGNGLTGTLPATGIEVMTNLVTYNVYSNNLTGNIPSPGGLTKLQEFLAYSNNFTSISELGNLPELVYFDINNNEISSKIPDLSGLKKIKHFAADYNKMTGEIPEINGLTTLEYFYADHNQLTGEMPSLSGLNNLRFIQVNNNQLSGEIPSFNGLTNLELIRFQNNNFSGEVPSLSGLNKVRIFRVDNNQLIGPAPTAPASLSADYSGLCPNYLDRVDNNDWDIATGQTPWHNQCVDAPKPNIKVQKIPTLNIWTLLVGLTLLATLSVGFARRR